jgi:hypothetical protein
MTTIQPSNLQPTNGQVTLTTLASKFAASITSLDACNSTQASTLMDDDYLNELSPEDLIYLAVSAQASIASLKTFTDGIRERLTAFREIGIVDDKLSCPAGTATMQTRETYSYSLAVKQLQDMEILEGIAKKKVTASWTIRGAKAMPK